ncbi:MAG TPA: hypothetical protein VH540_09745 [Ktedonobacterales bacterium]
MHQQPARLQTFLLRTSILAGPSPSSKLNDTSHRLCPHRETSLYWTLHFLMLMEPANQGGTQGMSALRSC